MSNIKPFTLLKDGEPDPAVEADKDIIKEILNDLIEKVDTEDIRSFVLVGIADSGDIVSARHVTRDYYAILGALSVATHTVNRLLDDIGVSTEQEY